MFVIFYVLYLQFSALERKCQHSFLPFSILKFWFLCALVIYLYRIKMIQHPSSDCGFKLLAIQIVVQETAAT